MGLHTDPAQRVMRPEAGDDRVVRDVPFSVEGGGYTGERTVW